MKRTLAITATAVAVALAWPAAAAAQTPTTAPAAGAYVAGTQLTQTQVAGVQVARTGQDSLEMVVLGGSLAAVGTVLVLGARRRRAPAAA